MDGRQGLVDYLRTQRNSGKVGEIVEAVEVQDEEGPRVDGGTLKKLWYDDGALIQRGAAEVEPSSFT